MGHCLGAITILATSVAKDIATEISEITALKLNVKTCGRVFISCYLIVPYVSKNMKYMQPSS